MDASIITSILFATIVAGTPLIIVALGQLIAEKSGVLNLGAEGMMAMGAIAAFAVTLHSGNPWLGVLAGMSEVAGPMGQITEHVSNNYGFAAIIVAFVARLNPVGIFFASLLMALLYLGGEQAQQYLNLPSSISNVFQGMLLMFLLGSDVFIGYRIRWREAVA